MNETKARGGRKVARNGLPEANKILVFNSVHPVERMSTPVYSCRQEVGPGAVIGSILLKFGIKTRRRISKDKIYIFE